MSHPSRNLLFHPSFSSPLWLINTCNLLTCYLLLLSCFSHVRLCATHSRQPTRLPRPQDSPGKNTGVGCHFLLQCMKVKSESEVAQSCPTLLTPWTVAHQAPPSMGFSRQKYWSGMPLPSPRPVLASFNSTPVISLPGAFLISTPAAAGLVQPQCLLPGLLTSLIIGFLTLSPPDPPLPHPT